MRKYINILKFLAKMGPKWAFDRLWYALKLKSNFFVIKNKKIANKVISLEKDKLPDHPIFIAGTSSSIVDKSIEIANNTVEGKMYTFSNKYIDYTVEDSINWHFHPLSQKVLPNNIPWHRIPDFGESGDIKLIWEASRFSFIPHFINAYYATSDVKYAQQSISLIIDWIDNNPFPDGVNYKCGQEISLRLFMWILAVNTFYRFISSEQKEKISKNVYASLLRIVANITYATKCVKNNHSISEAAGLFLGGLYFSNFPESRTWVKKGEQILKQELEYQVLDDGAFIQHSMNYHRLVVDVLSFSIWLSSRLAYNISNEILKSHQKLYRFLFSFVDKKGSVPNYGSNDGAYLFNITPYEDYRSSINFASAVNEGVSLFNDGLDHINFFGLKPSTKQLNRLSYIKSGYIQLFGNNSSVFVRCSKYKHRPAHSDALHTDITIDGKNIFCDTGTYSYNTDKLIKEQFTSVYGHNTFVIEDKDYLIPVLNFGAINWPNSEVVELTSTSFKGINNAYHAEFGVLHTREVKYVDQYIVINDTIKGVEEQMSISQLWHTEYDVKVLNKNSFSVNGYVVSTNAEITVANCEISRYYNDKSSGKLIQLKKSVNTDFSIITKICLNK